MWLTWSCLSLNVIKWLSSKILNCLVYCAIFSKKENTMWKKCFFPTNFDVFSLSKQFYRDLYRKWTCTTVKAIRTVACCSLILYLGNCLSFWPFWNLHLQCNLEHECYMFINDQYWLLVYFCVESFDDFFALTYEFMDLVFKHSSYLYIFCT